MIIKLDHFFPDRQEVLQVGFSASENFFPLAVLEIMSKGAIRQLPLIYTFFDPTNNNQGFRSSSDNIDEFGFILQPDGLLAPQFTKEALSITDSFASDYRTYLSTCQKLKANGADLKDIVEFLDEPEWWQWDQTPNNSQGKNMRFLCQVNIYDIHIDQCRQYFFFDETDNTLRTVYQRT